MSVTTCYGTYPLSLMDSLRTIKCVVFDVDGSITDGGIYFSSQGDELKKFGIKDGMGIASITHNTDINVCIVTGRSSQMVKRRADELKITYLYEGVKDKAVVLGNICNELKISLNEVLAFGDDINDMPMMAMAGLSACPADAHPAVLNHVNIISDFDGGHGAARQICDLLLMSKGVLDFDGFTFLNR